MRRDFVCYGTILLATFVWVFATQRDEDVRTRVNRGAVFFVCGMMTCTLVDVAIKIVGYELRSS